MHRANRHENIRLFRGVAVPAAEAEAVVQSIKAFGFPLSQKGFWETAMAAPREVRSLTAELISSPARIRDSLRALPAKRVLWACGDRFGGAYYAMRKDYSPERSAGILIEFEASSEEVCVDGKDFLYAVFQLWDAHGTGCADKVRRTLESLYGTKVLHYFEKAASCSNTIERIGLCDLACHDLEIIHAHYANRTLISGRCNTLFCSSFQMQRPVLPNAIRRIEQTPTLPIDPSDIVRLHDVL
jgi:hypothetical protein